MKARDDWYVDHMKIFEDLNQAIKVRYEMIERAIEAERKSQHMARAFTERIEEMVESRAAEMTIEEAETISSSEGEEPTKPLKKTLAEEVLVEEPAAEEPAAEEAEKHQKRKLLLERPQLPLGQMAKILGLPTEVIPCQVWPTAAMLPSSFQSSWAVALLLSAPPSIRCMV